MIAVQVEGLFTQECQRQRKVFWLEIGCMYLNETVHTQQQQQWCHHKIVYTPNCTGSNGTQFQNPLYLEITPFDITPLQYTNTNWNIEIIKYCWNGEIPNTPIIK